uniref:Putative addiction module component, TIGR02574 family n=1 Tax=Candidatus Kentrum sp. SD TaxID=2126332 RepID=A0A450Y9A9_9GAMM|nr:MAG: putative addiction module component, TIGR02574 family [Candidatus Kentron sp. SD]VFK42848.1 MAG: putative addiction module component, TIGR02574 family [Candidatus Kentron sp. SD]VFK78659.1 MAG: putative addiction module component, TIGR02574 family [Candidatus Kentron sp. SD]
MIIDQATIDEIKRLSIPEKVLIVEEIWDSIAKKNEYPEITGPQRIALIRRSDAYHSGSFEGRTWEEIKKDYWESGRM